MALHEPPTARTNANVRDFWLLPAEQLTDRERAYWLLVTRRAKRRLYARFGLRQRPRATVPTKAHRCIPPVG